ncbi:hypothetical protein F5Y17DRAFT_476419 [Xylariaceae sp. FL0594]|nr:hypothetical protein F5Y17DRAFT_476419 [Xylariaceae sp. FL0594]
MPQNTSFQFITSINTVTHDEETRRKVRSHARRQKLSSEPPSPPQWRKSSTQKERISKFRLKPSVQPSDAGLKEKNNNRCNGNGAAGGTASGSGIRKKSPVPPRLQDPIADAHPGDKMEIKMGDKNGAKTGGNLFTPTMLSQELGLVVTRELPIFPMLRIETTPLTENLLKYCFTVCLCPKEAMVEKWFNRAGAPTYMMTYYSGFLANAFAMNPRGDFFDALHVDTAITHAFMALVASMHNALARWGDTSTFDFHRLQAIKAINERLNVEGNSPNVPISDGITMAVALLVNNETFTGSIEAAATHMSGLKRIVDLRGGVIEGFKFSDVIQRALVWADFSYAYAAAKPLMFPFVPQLASSLSLQDLFQARQLGAATAHMEPQGLSIRNPKVIEVFELMHSITHCLDSFDYMNLANMSTERIQLSDSIYLAEWQLFQLQELLRNPAATMEGGRKRGARERSTLDLSGSLVYAGHLFMHLALRGQPPSAPRHRTMVEALMTSLYGTLTALDLLSGPESYGSPTSHYSVGSFGDSSLENWSAATTTTTTTNPSALKFHPTKSFDDFTQNALLWALFVGSCVRVPATAPESYSAHQPILLGDHHQFFIQSLKNYCCMRRICDKETLETKLRDVLWLDNWCENQVNLIWEEIGDYYATP